MIWSNSVCHVTQRLCIRIEEKLSKIKIKFLKAPWNILDKTTRENSSIIESLSLSNHAAGSKHFLFPSKRCQSALPRMMAALIWRHHRQQSAARGEWEKNSSHTHIYQVRLIFSAILSWSCDLQTMLPIICRPNTSPSRQSYTQIESIWACISFQVAATFAINYYSFHSLNFAILRIVLWSFKSSNSVFL